MGYRNLQACVADLEATGQLRRVEVEIDADLEAAAIHRRVYAEGGPALLFTRVKGCGFPLVSNLFGTPTRARFLFRDALESVRRLVELKIDPGALARRPWRYWRVPFTLARLRPRWVKRGPILEARTTIHQLPRVRSWPNDGGGFITLPQVYTEHPEMPGFAKSNLGMYRVQLDGNQYTKNQQIGLHYQIHRGIGVHHAAALRRGETLRVNIFVGGPPALSLAAVMPLPEGLPELFFAAALGGRRLDLLRLPGQLPMVAEADFCITGTVAAHLLPEGPFGDHLGYYSLTHDFPVLQVENVYHRRDAIWPFTVVGRPPQEDTAFGDLIHELTGPIIPTVVHGVHAVHAVDAAGVHPLLLAIGSERYTPYSERKRPQELLTNANAILGQGQLSLAKFLLIVAREDNPDLDIHDITAFLRHLLERTDWRRDLHFQTCTTMDTLDYSGSGLNEGSKVVIAAVGPKRRELATQLPSGLRLPEKFSAPQIALPGVLVVQAPRFQPTEKDVEPALKDWCDFYALDDPINQFPWIILADDSEFTSRNIHNFLWVTFTRVNPAADIHGIGAFTREKHWGCLGALVMDARVKPHHAPPLEEDPDVSRRIEAWAAPGGPLHGLF